MQLQTDHRVCSLAVFSPLAFLLLAGFLLPGANAQQQCLPLQRNPQCMRSSDLDRDALCWRPVNTLAALMACVLKPPNQEELYWCAYFNKNEVQETPNKPDVVGHDCWTPRALIETGAKDRKCKRAFFKSVMDACPLNNDRFLHCICAHHYRDDHLHKLSHCFGDKVLRNAPPTCPQQFLKRSPPPPPQVQGLPSELLEDDGETFFIDTAGRAIFVNENNDPIDEDGNVLRNYNSFFTLGFFDERVKMVGGRTGIHRCFIYPFSNRLWCTQWIVTQDQVHLWQDVSGPPTDATYQNRPTPQTSIATTRTVAPSSAPEPTVTDAPVDSSAIAQVTAVTAVQADSTGMAGTPIASGTKSDKGSAAISNVAPLSLLLGIQLAFLLI
ncbi:hypothetical protein PWT90_09164 [Aphanocladium album]|nr:hypothetical protein PWT90_09164 [Aphanocladium album]